MGQALYRKYRSKSLAEIVGQEHITETLARAVKSGRIAHAYLFTGPKGVGKTSIARILAHEINDLKYDDDSANIDIIEIDAASNRKLEETKALIEKVYVAPVSAKYKVYIIDEVHMLTNDSFNALLKTLEEPPAHVVFILATTEAHKLPETIISRTQRYAFRPIPKDKVAQHLSSIASSEKIAIEPEALDIIAEHGQGSFRDSISLLDQAANYPQPINASDISQLIGVPPTQLINDLLINISTSTAKDVVTFLHQLLDQDYPPTIIASQLAKVLRADLINGSQILDNESELSLLANLLDVSAASNPVVYLEICLLKSLAHHEPTLAATHIEQSVSKKVTSLKKPVADTELNDTPSLEVQVKASAKNEPTKQKKTLNVDFNQASWDEVLTLLRTSYNTLYGVVRMASVEFNETNQITLKFAFPFHQKRVNDPKNKTIIMAAVKKVTGQELAISCIVDTDLLKKSPTKSKPEIDKLDTISTIFGGAELLSP